MIEIRALTKKYHTHVVLEDIHLRFEPGKVYGIAGENGAGKTTLFRCIAGLETYQGEIDSLLMPLKNYLGFLNTDPYFFHKITGAEYLRLLCQARNIPIPDLDIKNVFDLPLHQYASTYSTGMKKKLAITALLLQQNEYFLLDEPFNGVDIQSNMLITEIILKLRSLNKTVVLSSHIFSTLRDTCDIIHLLRQGRIIQSATTESFSSIETAMKATATSNLLDRLGLA